MIELILSASVFFMIIAAALRMFSSYSSNQANLVSVNDFKSRCAGLEARIKQDMRGARRITITRDTIDVELMADPFLENQPAHEKVVYLFHPPLVTIQSMGNTKEMDFSSILAPISGTLAINIAAKKIKSDSAFEEAVVTISFKVTGARASAIRNLDYQAIITAKAGDEIKLCVDTEEP